MAWQLDICINTKDLENCDDICTKAVGEHPHSTGTFLGPEMQRDMQWDFETKASAISAVERLKATGLTFIGMHITKLRYTDDNYY